MSTVGSDPRIGPIGPSGKDLDVARDSDVPISTQIYWQLVYQIDSGRLLPGARLLPVRELGAALRVNPNTIRAVYRPAFGPRGSRRRPPPQRPSAAAPAPWSGSCSPSARRPTPATTPSA